VVAFLIVIVAAALIPAPTRAGERAKEAGRSTGGARREPATV